MTQLGLFNEVKSVRNVRVARFVGNLSGLWGSEGQIRGSSDERGQSTQKQNPGSDAADVQSFFASDTSILLSKYKANSVMLKDWFYR